MVMHQLFNFFSKYIAGVVPDLHVIKTHHYAASDASCAPSDASCAASDASCAASDASCAASDASCAPSDAS